MTDEKNNFEKDINVPHKEQIMIDGVNVRGCEQYNPFWRNSCGGLRICEKIPNCLYKQLARKTQECEELKKEYEKLKNTWLKQSKVLFLKKKSIEALKKVVLLKENNRYIQSCLTQEKQLEYEKLLNKLTRGVVLPLPEPEVIDLTARYRKALEEIEEVLKVDYQLPCASTVCSYPETCKDSLTNHGTECMRFALLKIKDIVNKAKGEE